MKRPATVIKKAIKMLQCERGVAYIEFALSIFMLLMLFFGSTEVSRYVLIMRKVQEASNEDTNMVTTFTTTTTTAAEMDAILKAVATVMKPYPFGTEGHVIMTDIYNTGAGPTVRWKYCGGGTLTGVSSKFGAIGTNATAALKNTLPNKSFALANGDELVVAEVFYRYTPIINNSITSMIVPNNYIFYNAAVSVPRSVHLNALIASNCT